MKVIDIFKNIADGKEVPKKIKFNHKTYIYKPEWKDYASEENMGLFVDVISSSYQITKMLNEEVEVLEEDKEIEEIKLDGQLIIEWNLSQIETKINEIINKLNELKKGK